MYGCATLCLSILHVMVYLKEKERQRRINKERNGDCEIEGGQDRDRETEEKELQGIILESEGGGQVHI